MASWHRSEYVSIPAARSRRYLLVIAMTGAFGGVTLAAALPDPPAQSHTFVSAQSSGGAIRNIIEEDAKAKAAADATSKLSAAGNPSMAGKASAIGVAKRAADPSTTGSIGRSGSPVTGRNFRAARADDAIARWLRKNGGVL